MTFAEAEKRIHDGVKRTEAEKDEKIKADFKKMRDDLIKENEKLTRLLEKSQEKREQEKKTELEEKIQKQLKETEEKIRADFDKINGLDWTQQEKKKEAIKQLKELKNKHKRG